MAISDVFLNNGCAVVCCIYNYDSNNVEFRLITSEAERNLAKGSKYIQSKPGDIFRQALAWLKANPEKQLLFVGMGCQAEGFRKYSVAKGFRDRVCIVDIVCHGMPSAKLWREYAEIITYNKELIEVRFRDKREGWENPTPIAVLKDRESNEKEEYSLKTWTDLFYNRCTLRPSCHECHFATVHREVDITIGDFWGIKECLPSFYDKKGVSLFLLHTEQGLNVFQSMQNSLDYEESNIKDCLQPNLKAPTPKSLIRSIFWNDYRNKGMEYVLKRYGIRSVRVRAANKIQRILSKGRSAINSIIKNS